MFAMSTCEKTPPMTVVVNLSFLSGLSFALEVNTMGCV